MPIPAPRAALTPGSKHRRLLMVSNDTDPTTMPLAKAATVGDLERARKIVDDAMAESARRNKARYASPARNLYGLRPRTVLGSKRKMRRQGEGVVDAPPPLLEITPVIAAAAARTSNPSCLSPLSGSRELLCPRTPPEHLKQNKYG